MKKTKQEYDAPDISVTQVEVETALCGSAKIVNPDNSQFGQIENQTINQDFGNGGWTETNSNNQWTTPETSGEQS